MLVRHMHISISKYAHVCGASPVEGKLVQPEILHLPMVQVVVPPMYVMTSIVTHVYMYVLIDLRARTMH